MARKNIFELPEGADASADQQMLRSSLAKNRPLLGLERPLKQGSPLGAISQSLDSINSKVKRAEEIELKLAEGHAVVEIDPVLVDASFVADRMEATQEQHREFVELVREHGQQVPILVRPKRGEAGRFEVAYGHRRLRAAQDLGRNVRAVVRDLSDEQLVVAQGQENSARTDLTFIERARFAARLEDRKFSREIIMAALNVDKAALSKMISVACRVPPDIIDEIGPAPAYGRLRWQELTDLLDAEGGRARARQIIEKPEFKALETDKKFEALHRGLSAKATRVRSEPWTADDGTRLARVTETGNRLTLAFDNRIAPDFGAFVRGRLQVLYDEYKRRPKDE
ncbi:chromosome partitioning protein, ParB family [Rhizobiales bacterium GAS113]|nr:chromosome partitioning protein, ParB family [Rhizobiales bacterium GAS113]